MTPRLFRLQFSTNSSHWVQVCLWPSVKAMRHSLRKGGLKDSHSTHAACWQARQPGTDDCVAEIHLARPSLCLEYIAHECAHAAWHRTRLQGLILQHNTADAPDDFQEFLANSTGILTASLVHILRQNRIPFTTFPPRK